MIFSKIELLKLLGLEEAAYGLSPIPGMKMIGEIQIDPVLTQKLVQDEAAIHASLLKELLAPDMASFGYVAMDPSNDIAHICIRGTETELEWAADAAALLEPLNSLQTSITPHGKVHAGFLRVFWAIQGSLLDLIEKARLDRPSNWVIQGHSLGAPMAQLCRLLLPDEEVSVCCWAAPRLGDKAFSAWWTSITSKCQAVINIYDLVPHLPPVEMGYETLGEQLRGAGGGSFFNPKMAHNLEEGYRPLLNSLP